MNPHLQSILSFIRQSKDLTAAERKTISQAVKKADDELKHKNHELDIESSLERVRAVALSMRQPDELTGICEVLFSELRSLGFRELRNAMINIHNDEKGSLLNYDYSVNAGKTVTVIPYDFHPLVEKQVRITKSASDAFYEMSFTGNELKNFRELRKKNGEPDDPKLEETSSLNYYFYSIGTGSIGISTYSSITERKLNVLKRFRNVFDFAYRRYMDVALAEAQAREAQIELALERIRARTMAMHRSDELSETSLLLFQQFKDLGATSEQISIGIFNEDKNIMELYSTLYGSQWKEPAEVDLDEPVVMKKINAAWKERKKSFVIDLAGNELLRYNAYRKKLSNLEYREDRWVIHIAFFSKGVLTFSATNPHPHETVQLLERFASVFEGTYTRFLDLQKAEAQAREAQIEASLEKVRGRAMAMHNSSDLSATASIIFTELRKLGIHAIRSGVGLLTKEQYKVLLYAATTSSESPELSLAGGIDMARNPCLKMQYESCTKKENYFPVLNGEELKLYYKELAAQISVPLLTAEQFMHEQYGYYFPFSEGYFYAWTEQPYSENEINILNRFKSIVDLTFRRYLDLQKAEAQAREAKIEAALERVRSKAMAMHKSDDLNAAVAIVFEELDKLNLGMLRCGIGILSKEKRCADVFTTTIAEEGHTVQVTGDESMDIHPLLHNAYESWLRNEDDYSHQLEGQEIPDYYRALTTTNFHLPESQQVLSERKGYKQFTYHANFQSGALFAFRDAPFPDEAKSVMRRFASVFNLTYQRFLDIQKAEAQAKEAQFQKQLIEIKHREITENISYALRIQTAILPAEKLVKEYLQNSFVLYLPKDVVAGDFYWMARVDDVILFSANDCTGHGVSGAMVSVICHNALNTAIREYNLTQPSLILDKVAELVDENFTQSEDKIQDGMDTSLCAYFPQQRKLQWAGANNPLWIIRKNEIIEYKPDKQPIGKYENRKPFTNHEIELQQGDNIYIFSDGYQDQFGGEKGKKLTKKGLKDILLSISEKNMEDQYEALLNYHNEWKGKEEQVDDICVIGVRV